MPSRTLKYSLAYTAASGIALGMATANACSEAIDFNTFLIEMTDGLKLITLINSIVVFYGLSNILFQEVLFGGIRATEYEHLVEKMPVFGITLLFNLASNDSNLILNCLILGFAFNFKFFHVIVIDRLDFITMKVIGAADRLDRKSALRQYLLNVSFWLNLVFIIVDFLVAKFLVYDVFQGINSITCLLFGFQFAILGVDATTYFCKYVLNVQEVLQYKIVDEVDVEDNLRDSVNVDGVGNLRGAAEAEIQAENQDEIPSGHHALDDPADPVEPFDPLEFEDEEELVWENKAYYVKAIDILSSSLKAIAHLAFTYLLTFHSGMTLPLSMIQGTYSSMRQTYTEVKKLFEFIESSKKLNDQLPNATSEDLSNSDSLCIICRDDMYPVAEFEAQNKRKMSARRIPKRLRCSHILHMGCLKDWLERSDSCPLCRSKVFGHDTTNVSEIPVPAPAPVQAQAQPQAAAEANGEHNLEDILLPRDQDTQNEDQRDAQRPWRGDFDSFDESPFVNINAEEIPRTGYQEITLVNPPVIPPGWHIIPLERVTGDKYQYVAKYSTAQHGVLKVKVNSNLN